MAPSASVPAARSPWLSLLAKWHSATSTPMANFRRSEVALRTAQPWFVAIGDVIFLQLLVNCKCCARGRAHSDAAAAQLTLPLSLLRPDGRDWLTLVATGLAGPRWAQCG